MNRFDNIQIITKSYLLFTAYKRSGTKNDLDKDRFSFLMAAQALEQRMIYISTLKLLKIDFPFFTACSSSGTKNDLHKYPNW